jgi:hypothetical protein
MISIAREWSRASKVDRPSHALQRLEPKSVQRPAPWPALT